MEYTVTPEGVWLKREKHFDLARSADCGQCFRFEVSESGCKGVIGDRAVDIRFTDGGYLFSEMDEAGFKKICVPYFDLERDYDAIVHTFESDKTLMAAEKYGEGIRLFSQPRFETLISFIISQNNNIPRIKGIISRLCEAFGRPIGGGQYAFPDAPSLAEADAEALAPLRAGFRAGYILDAAKKVASGEVALDTLDALPLAKARESLMTIRGVGPKVADCVLLFSCSHLDAFPADVWIKRALAALYPGRSADSFGPYGGLAQQYLFYYARETKII